MRYMTPLFFFLEVATYVKGLARRASLTEGSAGAAKSYKTKVTSLIIYHLFHISI